MEILERYLQSLEEGYIFSDKTISVNLSQFESGEKNKLLVIGLSGSGKTILAEKLADRYKTKWISIDSWYWRLRKKYFGDGQVDKKELYKRVHEEIIGWLSNKERLIIEGIDLLDIYIDEPEYRKLINTQPMIILGTSALKSGIRAAERNKNREGGEGWKEFYWMIRWNMASLEPRLKRFKEDIIKIPNVEIKEFKLL